MLRDAFPSDQWQLRVAAQIVKSGGCTPSHAAAAFMAGFHAPVGDTADRARMLCMSEQNAALGDGSLTVGVTLANLGLIVLERTPSGGIKLTVQGSGSASVSVGGFTSNGTHRDRRSVPPSPASMRRSTSRLSTSSVRSSSAARTAVRRTRMFGASPRNPRCPRRQLAAGADATMAVMTRHAPISSVPRGEYVPTADQRIVLSGVSWDAFEAFLTLRGNGRPLVTYLEGTLELMSPSRDHESIKKRFAEVVAAYLDHLGATYEGVGSWLLKHARHVGVEPDECFVLHDVSKERPDLALEVVWTSGGIELEVYRRLGVAEVWFCIDADLGHVLTDDRYELRATSTLLPGFDFGLVAEMLELPALSDVRRALRQRFEQ